VTRGAQTSAAQEVQVANDNDLKSPAINAARLTRFRSNLLRVDRCFAAIALVPAVPRNEIELERAIAVVAIRFWVQDKQARSFDAGSVYAIVGKDRPEMAK
jgi:hypothetical protein